MQNYLWKDDYNAIVLRWCIGYLNDSEVKKFLQKAQSHLSESEGRITKKEKACSFIFVVDCVLDDGEL